jgi:NADH-quinone oxidoreductase subunit J
VFDTILLYTLAILGLIGSIGMITHKNPIYSVLFLILNFFCIGGMFLSLEAEFLAVIQIIVYAGAIMVLFLFVIMLLNLDKDTSYSPQLDWQKGLSFVLGFVLLGQFLLAFLDFKTPAFNASHPTFDFGKVESTGQILMTSYLFPFEMISVILLAALMGAIVIAKKQLT